MPHRLPLVIFCSASDLSLVLCHGAGQHGKVQHCANDDDKDDRQDAVGPCRLVDGVHLFSGGGGSGQPLRSQHPVCGKGADGAHQRRPDDRRKLAEDVKEAEELTAACFVGDELAEH